MTPSKSSTASAGSSLHPSTAGRGFWHVLGTAANWLPAVCVLAPLAIVAWRATDRGGAGWSRVVEYRLWEYIGSTVLLLAAVVVLAVLLGVACAWLISAYEFPGRRTLQWLLILPLGVPGFVAGAAYLAGIEQLAPLLVWVRDAHGLGVFLWLQGILPWFGAVMVLVVTLYPYVYLSCRATFSVQQADLIEAARTLGSSPRSAFLKIVVPLARPGIVAGAALVAMETANEYGVVTLFGLNTLTPGVFRAWSEGSIVSAMRLAFILLTLVILVVVVERGLRGRRGYSGDTRDRPLARRTLPPGRVAFAWLICAFPLVLGFLWPVSRFVKWAIVSADQADWGGYLQALLNSVWLALLASALVVLAAFWLTAGRRAYRLSGGVLVQYAASLGYAIPSALLAVGVGVVVSDLSRIDGLAWLALSASAAGLMFAYWVRFMAVGIQPMVAGQAGVASDLHAAARTLGQSPSQALLRVDLRLLKPALGAAAILCFVDVFKELTLTLVMRPFDFETLATLTYRLSSEGRFPEASVPALVLIAGGMLGVAAFNRWLGSRS